MRLLSTLSAAVVLAVLTLAACNSNEMNGNKAGGGAGTNGNRVASLPSASPGHVAPGDGVKRVTTVELRDALDKGAAIIVDVRAAAAYQQSHIEGAINIPLEQVEARINELPRNKTIVTYCS